MSICPRGHESQAEDWCDFCGFPMAPPPGVAVPGAVPPMQQAGPPAPGPLAPGPVAPGRAAPGRAAPGHAAPGPVAPHPQAYPDLTEGLVICPICRSPQTGRYCEECGYDYDLSSPSRRQPPAPAPASLAPAAPPAPLNIPSAYGGTPAPQGPQGNPAGPGPGHPQPASGPYEQPGRPQEPGQAYEQPGRPQEAAPYQGRGQYQEPGRYEQPGHAYEQPAPYEQPAAPEGTGPVYAQSGPTGRGEEFGTSFNLAPPGGQGQVAAAAQQTPSARSTWMAVVSADREYFTDMMARSGPEAAGLFFPPYCPERRIPLTGRGQLRIGRRSQHRGTVPEIDLSVPPEDPGASHQHAMLAEQADGSWVLVDQDSTNGTTVNGGAEPIAPHTAVPLNDGDRVHIGAWTTITLHRA